MKLAALLRQYGRRFRFDSNLTSHRNRATFNFHLSIIKIQTLLIRFRIILWIILPCKWYINFKIYSEWKKRLNDSNFPIPRLLFLDSILETLETRQVRILPKYNTIVPLFVGRMREKKKRKKEKITRGWRAHPWAKFPPPPPPGGGARSRSISPWQNTRAWRQLKNNIAGFI